MRTSTLLTLQCRRHEHDRGHHCRRLQRADRLPGGRARAGIGVDLTGKAHGNQRGDDRDRRRTAVSAIVASIGATSPAIEREPRGTHGAQRRSSGSTDAVAHDGLTDEHEPRDDGRCEHHQCGVLHVQRTLPRLTSVDRSLIGTSSRPVRRVMSACSVGMSLHRGAAARCVRPVDRRVVEVLHRPTRARQEQAVAGERGDRLERQANDAHDRQRRDRALAFVQSKSAAVRRRRTPRSA